MKVRVTYVYEVDLGEDSVYDELVGATIDAYEDENLDIEKDVDVPVEHAVADYLVTESHVGNYNEYVKVADIKYETIGY